MHQSWSKIRKKLEQEYLCESLKGHVQYFFTIYHGGPDDPGRFAVRVDGKEVWNAHAYNEGAYDRIATELKRGQQVPRREWDGRQIVNDEANRLVENQAVKAANEIGIASTWDVISSIEEYFNLSIEDALQSPNAIIRMLAILDRRVGKRTLQRYSPVWRNDSSWLKLFIELRMHAERLKL